MFKYAFVANLPLSLSVKNFENTSTFGEVMVKSLVSCFLTHGVDRYTEKKIRYLTSRHVLYILMLKTTACSFLRTVMRP